MSSSAQNKYNNDGESDDTFFSLDDPVAVRNSHKDEVFVVERILAHKWDEGGVLRFKVKWVGHGPEFDTFEPASALENAKEPIKEYLLTLPDETRMEFLNGGRGRTSTRGTSAGGRADSDSHLERRCSPDRMLTASKEEMKRETESPAPKRETRTKKTAADEGASTSSGSRRSTSGGAAAGVAASAASAAAVGGIFQRGNDLAVVVVEGGLQAVVTLEEAHEILGFGLVRFLADNIEFED